MNSSLLAGESNLRQAERGETHYVVRPVVELGRRKRGEGEREEKKRQPMTA